MKVIDVIRQSAELLGIDSLVELIDQNDAEIMAGVSDNEDLKKLFSLTKFAMQELCTNYCPILREINFSTTEGKYAISNLPNYIRLVGVKKNGVSVEYKIYNRDITLAEDGIYTAEYMSYATVEGLTDSLDFLARFSPDVLVLAVCSYYAVAHGMFEQFEDFHDRYVERAESLRELRSGTMPMRKWE